MPRGGRLTVRQAAAPEDQEVSVHQPSVSAICGDEKIVKIIMNDKSYKCTLNTAVIENE
jgi:hypothetical protein